MQNAAFSTTPRLQVPTIALPILAVAIVAGLVWPALAAEVSNDDDVWFRWCSGSLLDALGPGMPYETYRPAFAAVLWLEVALFGDRLLGYRLTGLLVYLVGVLIAHALALRMVRHRLSAALVATLFAVSAVHHETLLWISGQPDLLSGTCVLFAMLAVWESGSAEKAWARRSWIAVGTAVALSAAAFKETGLIVIPLVFLIALLPPAKQHAGKRARWTAAGLIGASACLFIPFYSMMTVESSRLEAAIDGLAGRFAWAIPGLFSLIWPIPLEELKSHSLCSVGSAAKIGALAASAMIGVSGVFVFFRSRASGSLRMGLSMLLVFSAPFFMLNQHRLLYLTPLGFGILVASMRRRLALVMLAVLIAVNLAGFWQMGRLWKRHADIGRYSYDRLSVVENDRIALLDFPTDNGGVLGSSAQLARLRHIKEIEYLAPLRTGYSGHVLPSTLRTEDGHLVIERPRRWNDHLSYPCRTERLPLARIKPLIVDCCGDMPREIRIPLAALEGYRILRYRDGKLEDIDLSSLPVASLQDGAGLPVSPGSKPSAGLFDVFE